MSAEDGVDEKDFYDTNYITPMELLLRRNPFIFQALIRQIKPWFSMIMLSMIKKFILQLG